VEMLFCSHSTLHLTQLNISFAHLALMGSCQSQLTIIHVAILDWLCTNWGELKFLFWATWGLAGCQVCLLPIPFWSTFAPPTEDSCQFQKPLESTWLLPIGLFVSWLKKLINPLSVFRHISCSFFFLDPPPHP